MAEKALAGVTIIELCEMVAGPFCTKLLADFGAEVIKIEKPGRGDEARHRGPFLNDIPHPECSGLFSYLNTGKLGITLNIEDTWGKNIFNELIKLPGAILVIDKPPVKIEQLGLSYEKLSQISPQLILTAVTPFGMTGPYRDFKAYHLNVIHGGGEGYCLPGGKEHLQQPPLKIGNFVAEYDAGLNAALATLAALYARNITGQGQLVDISKQESVMSLYSMFVPRYINEELVVSRANQGYPYGGIMECKDGYVAIVCWFERDWQALMKLIGDPEWAKEDRFSSDANRGKHGDEINALLLEWTMKRTKDEIYHQGQAVGCPVGKVFTASDLVNSAHLQARQFFVEIEHPDMGKIKYPTVPYKFSDTPIALARAPRLGEHNEIIYHGLLGQPEDSLKGLREAGVI